MLKNFQAYELAVDLHSKCETIKAKRYLKDQLERASLSIVLNLKEPEAASAAQRLGGLVYRLVFPVR